MNEGEFMNKKNIQLKICGIRSVDEIMELKNLNIDYFGCIFAKSPREISIELASKITNISHRNNKKTVGVFVNEIIENIVNTVIETKIDRVQLHGNETPEYCKNLLKEIENINKKFNIKTKLRKSFFIKNELPNLTPYLPYIEYPLFDTKGENKGGNGTVFDWNILKNLDSQKFILAGGLSTKNIFDALKFSPTILDVNSKVEINNRKSKQLIKEIINIVKL